MITFAFTVLSFILFAAAGVFAYRHARQELRATLKSHLAKSVRKDRERQAVVNDLAARLAQAENTMKQILALPGNKGFSPITTFKVKENMEERAIRERPTVVAVDSVQKVINQ